MLTTTDKTTASNVNIRGNAVLFAGTFGAVTHAKNVVVSGATVESIVGGTDTVSIEIHGGDSGMGNYRPNDFIKRSEACVIFTRIAPRSERAK